MAAAAMAGRGVGRAAAAGAAASRAAGTAARQRLETLFNTGGIGFRDLAVAHVSSTFGDTMVTLALAGTLFFSVPSSQARGNVALYLVLTVAPFAVIGPVLGWLLDSRPTATRGALILSAVARACLALAMVWMLDGLWLFPAAFGLLVASRVHGIARNALLPIALDAPAALVAANGRLATISVIGGTAAAPIGALLIWVFDARAALIAAMLGFVVAALSGRLVPRIEPPATGSDGTKTKRTRFRLPRTVRLAQLATAVVRVLNGFLLLLLAFAFKDLGGGILDLGAVLAAGGGGFFVASLTSPALEQRLREEPMVVAGLAVEAAAAFIAGQWFGLPAAAFLAAAAGFAWGTAKLAFDGLLQFAVPEGARGSAFTRSETLFQLAWVAGAFVPTALPLPTTIGLVLAGLAALSAQVVYVSHLLIPLRDRHTRATPPPGDVNSSQ